MSVSDELKLIFKLCSIFGLTPVYNFRKRFFQNSKISAYAHTIFIAPVCIYAVYATKWTFLYLSAVGILAVFTITNTFRMGNLSNTYNSMLKNFDCFDNCAITKNHIPSIKYKNAPLYFIIGYVVYTIYDFFQYGWYAGLISYFIYAFLEASTLLIMAVKYNILEALLLRLVAFNSIALNQYWNYPHVLDCMVSLHANLCDILDGFNHIFGWHILTMQTNFVLQILTNVDWVLKVEIYNFSFQDISWIFYCNIFVILFTMKCEMVKKESKSLLGLLIKLQHRSGDHVYNKFETFIKQVVHRDFTISAAGFFNVNCNMLYTLVNVITTYLVVVIQMNYK